MQVPGVRVERLHLAVHGLDDMGVTVADPRDVVVDIEVSRALGVPEVLPLAPHKMDGFPIEEPIRATQQILSAADD